MNECFAGFFVEFLAFEFVDEKVDEIVLLFQLVKDFASVIQDAFLAFEVVVETVGETVFERFFNGEKVFNLG